MQKLSQNGSHIVGITLGLVVVAAVAFAGWRVLSNTGRDSASTKSNSSNQKGSVGSKFVEWQFDGEKWAAVGTAPECESPLAIESPMDASLATSILYPGQIRGGDFKPHGGIGSESANNAITVKAIRDAYLYQGSRYIEAGEIQYMFDFMDSCGVMYRLDHLTTLSADFVTYANELPAAKPDDSRTTKFKSQALVKTGTVIATEVGFKKTKNSFIDLGVYDLRKPNDASKTDLYKTNQLRISDKSQSFYALCWLDLLPTKDRAIVKALPPRDSSQGKTSDYCTI